MVLSLQQIHISEYRPWNLNTLQKLTKKRYSEKESDSCSNELELRVVKNYGFQVGESRCQINIGYRRFPRMGGIVSHGQTNRQSFVLVGVNQPPVFQNPKKVSVEDGCSQFAQGMNGERFFEPLESSIANGFHFLGLYVEFIKT
jgi:hypothetical protein